MHVVFFSVEFEGGGGEVDYLPRFSYQVSGNSKLANPFSSDIRVIIILYQSEEETI